jgi:hypothetical protein
VGRLIAIDPAHPDTIYLGTLTGIKKSTDGGVKWTPLALTGNIIRSLIMDGGLLYAAVERRGVYRCTADGALTLFNGSAAPAEPEEPSKELVCILNSICRMWKSRAENSEMRDASCPLMRAIR